jgi:hypothetical protein
MNFYVGQKVVCVNDAGLAGASYSHPMRGNIYTISAIGLFDGAPHVDVVEFVLYPVPLAWKAYRFRPAIQRKTDITIFTEILDKSRSKEPAY